MSQEESSKSSDLVKLTPSERNEGESDADRIRRWMKEKEEQKRLEEEQRKEDNERVLREYRIRRKNRNKDK